MNFRCGSCGSLMDVEDQFLAQPVHCPNCQQIMQPQSSAPPPSAELPPEITFDVPVAADDDSIFEAPDHAGDDLFGSGTGPSIEIPAETRTPSPSPEIFSAENKPPCMEPAVPSHAPDQSPDTSTTCTAFEQPLPANDAQVLSPSVPSPAPAAASIAHEAELPPDLMLFESSAGEFATPAASESPSHLPSDTFPADLRRRPVPTGIRSSLFIALVVIPLISYSVLATIALLILYLRPPQPSLEYLPDVEGDFQGAKRHKRGSISYPRLDPDSPLPDRVKVTLKHSVRLGDLEIVPERVALRRLKVRHPDLTLSTLPGQSLVLHLLLKNVSQEVSFSPTDPYFDRLWKSLQDSKPYTFLEIGAQRFYGGPLLWRPGQHLENRPSLEGQVYQVLQPGEQLSTFVCTAPDEAANKLALDCKDPLLWRVQVRRGLVRVGEREVPVTAVIGVEFTAADIEKQDS